MAETVFSSPNRMVWEYFQMVQDSVARAHQAPSNNIERQETAITIVMAVTAVEVFINLYFRVIIEEPEHRSHKERIINDTLCRISLDKKLKQWPRLIFGNNLNFSGGPAKDFMQLKKLRNHIVHFTSNHETIDLSNTGITMHGVADTSEYDALSKAAAKQALHVSWGVIEEVISLSGVTTEHTPRLMHSWYGMPFTHPT